jgi:hypothetical protein
MPFLGAYASYVTL